MRNKSHILLIMFVFLLMSSHAVAVLEEGDQFIPFSLKNVDERDFTVKMEDGRLTLIVTDIVDGKPRINKSHPDVILLDFWATWCVPCRKAMPYMQKLHEKYGSAADQVEGGLRLLGIAIDEKGSRIVRPFYPRMKITYPMLTDPTTGDGQETLIRSTKDMQDQYKVQEIPVVYLIDAKGTITHVHVGFKEEHVAELDNAVKGLIGRTGE